MTVEDFPIRFEPSAVETAWYDHWEANGYFQPEVNPEGTPFSVVIPPPNVTGSLHMGHAFEHALIDATIRRKRMQGYRALWLPGTDHAGIATQNVVERELAAENLTRQDLGREAFIDRVWEWKAVSGGRITEQMRRMGSSCDWSRERFTMDDGLSRAVRIVFVRLYEKGLMYRANRIINWCPRCETALSDIEVEHREVQGELVYIRYPVSDAVDPTSPDGSIVVATTRAETMLGDTGVAVHPDDERYKHLIGKLVQLPFVGQLIPIVADEAVDPAFGTGAVKITPAHDPNDFEIGQRHDLPAVNVMSDDGVMNAEAGPFEGLGRFAARKAVIEELDKMGALVRVEPHMHAVGHCYRCKSVVEPRLSLQWFLRQKPLAERAVEEVKEGNTSFVPKRWENLYFSWMDNVRDWCVSRQIWWGHRIPAWYCQDCSKVVVTVEDPTGCPGCASRDLIQDDDVLDTWFSSALWPMSTMGWPERTDDFETFYPTSMLHTGFDIIYFWVARMLQMGLEFAGEVPFADVAIHGLIRDAEGRKMSKSSGNVVDPLDVVDRFGVDALRYAMVRAASPGQDVPLAEEWIEGARNFVNKLWNASRFVAMNLDGKGLKDFEPVSAEEAEAFPAMDRWIMSRMRSSLSRVDHGFEQYDFAEGVRELHGFTWSEFCDWYIELAKGPLQAGGDDRVRTQRVLVTVLSDLLALLHPVIPFVTEELWHRLGADGDLMVAPWPIATHLLTDPDAELGMSAVIEIVGAIRRFRSQMMLSPAVELSASIVPADDDQRRLLAALAGELESLANLSSLAIVEAVNSAPGQFRDVAAGATVVIPYEGLLDVESVIDQLDKKIAKVESELSATMKKLQNASFVERAPADVVEEAHRRRQESEETLETLRSQREQFA